MGEKLPILSSTCSWLSPIHSTSTKLPGFDSVSTPIPFQEEASIFYMTYTMEWPHPCYFETPIKKKVQVWAHPQLTDRFTYWNTYRKTLGVWTHTKRFVWVSMQHTVRTKWVQRVLGAFHLHNFVSMVQWLHYKHKVQSHSRPLTVPPFISQWENTNMPSSNLLPLASLVSEHPHSPIPIPSPTTPWWALTWVILSISEVKSALGESSSLCFCKDSIVLSNSATHQHVQRNNTFTEKRKKKRGIWLRPRK